MTITAIKIYAQIKIGNGLLLSSPDPATDGIILSFQVTQTRSAPTTFSASLKVLHEKIQSSPVGNVEIWAGTSKGTAMSPSLDLIFTGFLQSAKMRPCFDDPSYVLMDIQGTDVLHTLQGKTFTSRSRATKSSWASITGVQRKGLKSGKFKPTPQESFTMMSSDPKRADVVDTSAAQYSPADKAGAAETASGSVTPNVTVKTTAQDEPEPEPSA
ncbi:MAG: hypothetical protein DRP42_01430 [Tenericutes bacterium]|nr:MAG: hypothetical protein DRP42_01430 [Mycoplasmatota bacterium]